MVTRLYSTIISDFAFTNTGYFQTAPSVPDAASGFSGAIGDEGSIASFGQAPTYEAPEFTLTGNDYPSISAIDLTKAGNALISLDAGDIEAPGAGAASIGTLGNCSRLYCTYSINYNFGSRNRLT